VRNRKERTAKSPFLAALCDADIERIVATFFRQIEARRAVLMAAVIDKRHIRAHVDAEILHKKAYEFLLERIEQYMHEYHPRHSALVVMDDTSKQLNRAVAMKHAFFQRRGNQNVQFRHIVEYPFFTRSELSNGIQLADLVAYSIYRAFREENFGYPYFAEILPHFYHRQGVAMLDGLKVWPEGSPLVERAREARTLPRKTPPTAREGG
jgi:hypothetical protein